MILKYLMNNSTFVVILMSNQRNLEILPRFYCMNRLSIVVDFDVLFQEFEKICQHFIVFDEQFEYGARLPPMFIRFVY